MKTNCYDGRYRYNSWSDYTICVCNNVIRVGALILGLACVTLKRGHLKEVRFRITFVQCKQVTNLSVYAK